MEHGFLDEMSRIPSPMRRLDPRIKVLGFVALLLSVVLTPGASPAPFVLYAAILAVLVALSRLPVDHVFERTLVILPFAVMTALFIPFLKGTEVLWSFDAGPLHIVLAREGLEMFAVIVVKSFLSILCVVLLTATTGFPELLRALERLRCPSLVILILSFMYRYLFVVQDEFMKMRLAKESRSAGRSRRMDWKALSGMAGVLFVRSYERAEAVYLAMCSRGYCGRIVVSHDFRLKTADAAFAVLLAATLVVINLYAW
ncbi:MAG TPA: cobalt ECF transporter T component CbiQ [Syntrophales bacterium]|nr:cobalt ECF transporter T component CbiQ [Syntrophobacterales bacterium]HQL89918.1 cobalt ECF transporter T component CbiQ [Syntrophales bacterium]